MFIVYTNENDEILDLNSCTFKPIKCGLNSLDCIFRVDGTIINFDRMYNVFLWYSIGMYCNIPVNRFLYFRIVLPLNNNHCRRNIRDTDCFYVLDECLLSDKYPIYSIKTIEKFNVSITYSYVQALLRRENRLNIIKYLYSNKPEVFNWTYYLHYPLDSMSKNGNVNCLEWWKNSGLELAYSSDSLDWASHNDHINVLEWWLNSGLSLKYSSYSLDGASQMGHIHVLEWWKNSGLPLKYSENALSFAHRNVFKWWKKSGLPLKYPSWTIYLYMKFFV
uniref:Ankyrin repeat protein n=1 Tax=viral metagenome TaxID=1070528 RepID=A0A6C0E7G4_9ZZZZ